MQRSIMGDLPERYTGHITTSVTSVTKRSQAWRSAIAIPPPRRINSGMWCRRFYNLP